MTRFVPASSEANAALMSSHLWSLSRPESIREPGEISADWCVVRPDAAGQWWLQVETDEAIFVHPTAVLDGIADLLLAVGIPQASIGALDALVISLRGQTMTPWQFFPEPFRAASKLEHEIQWPSR